MAHEIYQTEKDYVHNLNLLFDVFLNPIKSHMNGPVWVGQGISPRFSQKKKDEQIDQEVS